MKQMFTENSSQFGKLHFISAQIKVSDNSRNKFNFPPELQCSFFALWNVFTVAVGIDSTRLVDALWPL